MSVSVWFFGLVAVSRFGVRVRWFLFSWALGRGFSLFSLLAVLSCALASSL